MDLDQNRPAFERGTGFLLARLGTLALRSWSAFLGEVGLTQSRYAVLYALAEFGATGQRRLAERATMEPGNVGYVIDELVSAGLVERAVDPAHRRRRRISITDDGATLMASLQTRLRGEQIDFLSALTDEERVQLNALLRRLWTSHASTGESDYSNRRSDWGGQTRDA
jgi:DNA-binding MarR family transcriptional regulator